jgi:hypothetical protein
MTLRGAPALTIIVLLGLGVQAKAQAPCAEVLRLRNAASEAWKYAMSAPASQRCGALAQASVATKATLNYADNNRQSCNISDRLLNEVDGYHRQAVQAHNNVCAGRPLRSYRPDIIQR